MSVITRFAPSPTGYLHIGGARTALFNWLFAKHHGGIFRLRIEDTDRARSTPAAVDAIMDGLRWLGLHWDGDAVLQFARAERHAAVARDLLAAGKAYLCYCTPAELTEMRESARSDGRPPRYDGRWRDRDPALAPPGVAPAVRIKAPQSGETVIQDLVQGEVRFGNDQLDDMILLRGDGTPTYMLSVVVDDHDMDITHVIRGDDHLNNAARQTALYQALGWDVPAFAHIPLIHGADGAKLSKRHGALSVNEYDGMGILPEAMRNYLLRLGWGHGDAEIIGTDDAIAWFGLEAVGRSPARFDMNKLLNLNGHYLRQADDRRLVDLILPRIIKNLLEPIDEIKIKRLIEGMPGLKERAKDLNELANSARFYALEVPLPMTDKAVALLNADARDILRRVHAALQQAEPWSPEALEAAVRRFVEDTGTGLGKVAQPLRAALTGATTSPGIFDVLAVLGRDEALARIVAACTSAARAST